MLGKFKDLFAVNESILLPDTVVLVCVKTRHPMITPYHCSITSTRAVRGQGTYEIFSMECIYFLLCHDK